jgi:hypothetical protein
MHATIRALLIAGLASTGLAHASITLNAVFGPALDSSGNTVPDGTLWALVVDDGDNSFAGGFGLGGAIASDTAAQADFTPGQQLAVGNTIGSDLIFAMGGFNGDAQELPGFAIEALELTLGGDLATGRETAFYFFPGVIYTTPGTYAVGSQVGGLNALPVTGGDYDGYSMVIPPDSTAVSFGAIGIAAGGNVSDFQAMNLIPEPSAALLGALGALRLLRRRR